MAVESLLLTAKVDHLSEDFGRRGAFSGVSNLNFSVTKFSLGTLRSHGCKQSQCWFEKLTHVQATSPHP